MMKLSLGVYFFYIRVRNYSGVELLPSASPAHRAAVRCLLVCAPIYVAWGEGLSPAPT